MIATALVYIFTDDGKKSFKGCGALVEGGFIATCRHVWLMAADKGVRTRILIEFPKIKSVVERQIFATMAHTCEDGMPDLVLLTPSEIPIQAMPLQVARAPKFAQGLGYALAALRRPKLIDVKVEGMISDHRSGMDELQEFSCASSSSKYWLEHGSSGSPVFLDQGMQLAGLVSLSDLPANAEDQQSGKLREAFVVPGDLIWRHVATATTALLADQVPANSLRKILEDLGQQGVAVADIPAKLAEAIASMREAAAAPTVKTNLGADVDRAIASARRKLETLDRRGALAGLARMREEVSEVRKDAIRREIALLWEQAKILRLSFDRTGALAALDEIVRLDPEEYEAFIDAGEIHIDEGGGAKAQASFEQAVDVAEAKSDQARIYIALIRLGAVHFTDGNLPAAFYALDRALKICEMLAQVDPHDARLQRELSVSFNRIGDVRLAEGDSVNAIEAYEKALCIAEGLALRDPDESHWQHDLSVSHTKIGDFHMAEGDYSNALDAYEKGLPIAQGLVLLDPSDSYWQRALALYFERLGDAHFGGGSLANALEAFENALVIRDHLAQRDPGNRLWQRELAVPLWRLAELGQNAEANLQRVVEILGALEAAGRLAPPDREYLKEVRQLRDTRR